jgi:hypothetical protein
MLDPATRLLLLLLAALAAGEAAFPCYALIDSARYVETTCFTPLIDYSDGGKRVVLRAFPPAAAHVVEAAVLIDPGNPFGEDVEATADYIFNYFTGVNAKAANLSSSLTAPFTVRPPAAGREGLWVGSMALAPSKWPPASAPPSPRADGVSVRSFGGVVIASVPVALPAAPAEGDFLAAFEVLADLLARLPVPGRWRINASSPLSPSFSYFLTQRYSGSSFEIEASAEVYHAN